MDQQQGASDMVFCHVCQNEWYRDEHGLICPSCNSEFTEIIEADHDPRDDHLAHDSLDEDEGSLDAQNPWAVPDPEEQAPGPHDFGNGFRVRRSGPNSYSITGTWTTALDGRPVAGRGGNQPGQDPLLSNFVSMMESITGGALRLPQASQGRQQADQADQADRGRSTNPEGTVAREGPRVTYTSSAQLFPRDANNPGPHVVPFDNLHQDGTILERLLACGNLHPQDGEIIRAELDDPEMTDTYERVIAGLLSGSAINPSNEGDDGYPAPSFTRLFARLLGQTQGDFVDEEDFDRIMSQLMEQHVSGDAPGPATEATIAALPKKSLTRDMVGGKDVSEATPDSELNGECSICIEKVQIGEEVAVLPCGHWFHNSCIATWLREHDTCPHCRKGVDHREDTGNDGQQGPTDGGGSSSGSGTAPSIGGNPSSGNNTRGGANSNMPQTGNRENAGLQMPGGFDAAAFGDMRRHSHFAPLRTHHIFSTGHVHPMDLFDLQRALHHDTFLDTMRTPFAYETHAVYATGQPHLFGFSQRTSAPGQRRRRSSFGQITRFFGHSLAPSPVHNHTHTYPAERQSVGDRLRGFFR